MNATLFIDLAVKSAAILLTAWLITLLFKKSSAASKHLIWLAAFCVLLVAPVLSLVMPARQISLVGSKPVEPVSAVQAVYSTDAIHREPIDISPDRAMAPAVEHGPTPLLLPAKKVAKWVPDWTRVGAAAVIVWLLGVLLVSFQSLFALISVSSLRQGSHRFEPAEGESVDLRRLARQLGVSRNWDLRVCAGPKVPAAMTWGVMNPVVMIPQESTEWSQERLEAVLLHELAHVRRFDSLSQLIAAATCAIYWFNPAVWLCARAMRAEAEIAADDTVLTMGVKPSVYARELVRIASELGTRRQPYSNIGVPVMKKSKIESRVQAILDPSNRRKRGITTVQMLTTAAVAAALVVPVSMLRASLVPIEPHGVSFVHPSQSDAQAKQTQERALEEAIRAKVLAEQAAQRSNESKESAEAKEVRAVAEKRLAEAEIRVAEAQRRSADKAKRFSLQDRKAAALKAYKQALANKQMLTKAQVEEKLKRLFEKDRDQIAALAQLQEAKAQIKSQLAQLAQTRQQLAEALAALKAAKAGKAGSTLEGSYKGQLEKLYEQGELSKQELLEKLAHADGAGASAAVGHPFPAALLLEQAVARLEAEKASSEEAKRTYDAGVSTKADYDRARAAYKAAENEVKLLQIIVDNLKNSQGK